MFQSKVSSIFKNEEFNPTIIDAIKINDVVVRVVDCAPLGTLSKLNLEYPLDIDHKKEDLTVKKWIKLFNSSKFKLIQSSKIKEEMNVEQPMFRKTYFISIDGREIKCHRYYFNDNQVAAFNIEVKHKSDWKFISSQIQSIALKSLFYHKEL